MEAFSFFYLDQKNSRWKIISNESLRLFCSCHRQRFEENLSPSTDHIEFIFLGNADDPIDSIQQYEDEFFRNSKLFR